MSPLASSKPLLPEAGNLFPLGIYQLHGVIHQVSGKDVKTLSPEVSTILTKDLLCEFYFDIDININL